ncbi:hypothetical protein [Persicobacter psychrovividus]|uniref:Uncharacterized protein n=1 Tax=Persicobacter psychrovividus TaxID=387638 RepID=A0ABN6LER8_9BACT|nr:hypothetical protein PEPS_36580 [Persicobacter psychrovividus]BDD01447.1 hypothetical protein PEPS_37270 [Persicobacter psychrovividus]BDD01476.1 hypothetical protein PEPS_37560 [Persicobacter psychrovividus]
MNGETIFLIVWVIVAAFILTTFYKRGKKALSIFPDIHSVRVVYRDKSASGHSNKSWTTKMGGARNALDIVVTDKELWLKSMLLFAGIGKHYDLLHKVSLDNIIRTDRQGRKITVDFKTEDGKDKQVVFMTKRPDDFLKAIKK